jgi:hypothetical protein
MIRRKDMVRGIVAGFASFAFTATLILAGGLQGTGILA